MATKQEELNALKKIGEIVNALGVTSYIGIAFEGVLEDAKENIENDWACSWKQRAEAREEEAVKAHEKMRDAERRYREVLKDKELLTASIDRLTKETLEQHNFLIDEQNKTADLTEQNDTLKRDNERLTDEIIKLKARLFDLMEERR